MSAKPLRAAVPTSLLSYLNSFERDRNHYILDPEDERRVVVANQQIFKASTNGIENTSLKVGDIIRLFPKGTKLDDASKREEEKQEEIESKIKDEVESKTEEEERLRTIEEKREERIELLGIEVVVIGQSLWRPGLLLLQGIDLHKFKSGSWKNRDEDIEFETVGCNIVTTTSDSLPQAHDPTRTSNGGIQAHDPTRTSDGSTRNIENFSEGIYTHLPVDHCVPLTEFWLGKAKEHNETHTNSPIVAILDTGIDLRYDWTMSAFPEPNCPLWFNEEEISLPLQKDLIGWNFVGTGSLLKPSQHNNPFDDDATHKHGTRIAAILAQQCQRYTKTDRCDYEKNVDVRLMILKTHDYRGIGLLFDIFCAFDYVLYHPEVEIINASWGFYGTEVAEFTTYMYKFEKRKIWFVAAAGNSSDFEDNFRPHELTKKSDAEHYPACYSLGFEKVLTVTTALFTRRIDSNDGSKLFEIQPYENYSKKYVDVAITAGRDGSFPEPLRRVDHVIRGTSYATAYAIGKLVRSNHVSEGKTEFLGGNVFISRSNNLSKYVRNGCFITSDVDEEKERI